MTVDLIHGDCLIENAQIESGCVDLILTDLPYGIIEKVEMQGHDTSWDKLIDPKRINEIANRLLRKNGKMVLFGNEPFSSNMVCSAIPNIPFSYRMIWEKDSPAFSMYIGCKKRPMSYFEDILVFSKTYDHEGLHPLREYFKAVLDYVGLNLKQINTTLGHRRAEHTFYVDSTQYGLCTERTYRELIHVFEIDNMAGFKCFSELAEADRAFKSTFKSTFNIWDGKKYKGNILKYKKDYGGHHPTQKPVLLLEDLIKTYSDEGNTVVDLTMGSGSTGVACVNTDRNFIGIEQDADYFKIAQDRIADAQKQHLLVAV